MNLSKYKKSILSQRMLRHTSRNFLVIAGIFSVLLQILQVNLPDSFDYGWKGIVGILVSALGIALIRSFPKKSFSVAFAHPDTKISVRVGDMFEQDDHLVIGFCDTFDTEIGDIISASSMQGQFLAKIYDNDCARLDAELAAALSDEVFETDTAKTHGKNARYGIGTTAVLNGQGRKIFCCAYSKMGTDLKATSDIQNIWLSLQCLWNKVRVAGEQKPIVLPMIGTSLSRVGGISYSIPIKLIMLSFIVNSRVEPIAKELRIIIREGDMEKINLLETEDFAKSLNH